MKRYLAFALALVCLVTLAGCAAGHISFNISGAGRIELCSGEDGTAVEISDAGNIKYITDNINDLKFSKGESSKDYGGWSYRLRWYDAGDKLIEEIVVMSEYLIDYDGHFCSGMEADHEIDTDFLDALLENAE